MIYDMPALVGPHDGELLTEGAMKPLIELPAIFQAERSIR